jgi:crotonobetainyl-CoA:carnitine CoA-transferase CaiB-like acyl-CoA transferase
MESLMENRGTLIDILDREFAGRTMDEWCRILDDEGVWWTPVRSPMDTLSDPQAQAAGAWVDSPVADGRATTIASPVDFFGTPWSIERKPPDAGEHTQEVVRSLGYSPDDVTKLVLDGAFG